MEIGAIIQARTSSTRLPRKVLKELPIGSGITVLEQVIRRVKKSKKLNVIIVATTIENCDDIIVNIAKKEKVNYFRGSREDVLSRYYLAAKEYGLDIIVRICSDCPYVNAKTIDAVISKHIAEKADYASGLYTEVFSLEVLDKTYFNAISPYDREHVTPYMRRDSAFKQTAFPEQGVRLTLDTEQDYAFLCAIFSLTNEYYNS